MPDVSTQPAPQTAGTEARPYEAPDDLQQQLRGLPDEVPPRLVAATAPDGATAGVASVPPAVSASAPLPMPVLPLDYADRSLRRRRFRWWWWVLVAVRRLVFAFGVALFCGGVAYGMWHDDSSFMAVSWGAGLVALILPFPALARRPAILSGGEEPSPPGPVRGVPTGPTGPS